MEAVVDNTDRFEQYMTACTSPIERVLGALDLSGRSVIEIGVGKGALTSILLERGARVKGYEIDPQITPKNIRSRIEFIPGDFKEADFECARTDTPLLVANPPYRELFVLREKVMLPNNLADYVLFIPAAFRMYFPEAEMMAHMEGDEFTPAAIGQHLIIRGESDSEKPLRSTTDIHWYNLMEHRDLFAPPSEAERDFIELLVNRAKERIDQLPAERREKPILLLLTEDLSKLKLVEDELLDNLQTVVQAEHYSHPEYIAALTKLEGVIAVARYATSPGALIVVADSEAIDPRSHFKSGL